MDWFSHFLNSTFAASGSETKGGLLAHHASSATSGTGVGTAMFRALNNSLTHSCYALDL